MNKRVLVVDDDAAILEAITLALESEGYTVEDWPNLDGILALSPENIPDIILTDMLLGPHQGGDVIQKLQEKGFSKKIPVIMLSAHPNGKQYAHEHGADDFLEKPFDIDELLKMIEQYTS